MARKKVETPTPTPDEASVRKSKRGRGSRAKGQRGERDAIDMLQPLVQRVYEAQGLPVPVLQRNTLQSDTGGHDIAGLAYFSIEVKNVERLTPEQWWHQCKRQCRPGQTGLLLYKRNRVAWRARFELPIAPSCGDWRPAVVDTDIDSALVWFEAMLTRMVQHETR